MVSCFRLKKIDIMQRKHFISKPYARSSASEGNQSWELYAAYDWATNDYPLMIILAACTSEDAVLAAKRLLLLTPK